MKLYQLYQVGGFVSIDIFSVFQLRKDVNKLDQLDSRVQRISLMLTRYRKKNINQLSIFSA